jgi:ribosomal protein S21
MADPKDIKRQVNITLPENVPVDYAFEKMLKSFQKDVMKNGILKEVKRRKYYTKPSEQKRLDIKNRRP